LPRACLPRRGAHVLEKSGFWHLSQFRLGPLRIAAARAPLLAGIRAVPTIDFTDAELAAVTAAIHRAIEDDKFPHAPRLVPMRTAMAKLDDAVMLRGESEAMAKAMAPRPNPDPNAPPPAKADKRVRR
jgi:hypothetical protein